MAHFRGIVQGSRGEVSRLAHASTGLTVHADGWNLGVTVFMRYNDETKQDEAIVTLTDGSGNRGLRKDLGVFSTKDLGEDQK